ncbi:rhodanese-like domain-containing protein [Methylobacter psychrophilus]|uniref:rhodanese-like domain-containing protein n=1 Tax=Methylobacter psychrophilus TaxID=96941 RepID=UPI0021D4C7D8|nr:rhodanese-like domain-containing protein [Methylobacter psychrophilus]
MRLLLRFFQSAFIILLIACAVERAEAGSNESLSPKEASSMSAAQKAVIVDVREDSEWNEQHIPGAIHIPLGQLNERLAELKQYKDSPVITQCRSGGRSLQAVDVLTSAGFSNVYNMEGGIMAWDKAGLKTQ